MNKPGHPPTTVGGKSLSQPEETSSQEVDAFVALLAKSPANQASGRLLFAMDATLSRQPAWDKAVHIQSTMFEEAGKVNGLAMKLVYFRGYDECRASPWKSDGLSLARLMQRVTCLGGQTQISRVLDCARKQIMAQPVSSLVYIGDAVEENPDRLVKGATEPGMLGCKLFIFQDGGNAQAAAVFKAMARHSGGGYFQFDASSANRLAALLRAVARYASGGRKALEARGSPEERLLLEQLR